MPIIFKKKPTRKLRVPYKKTYRYKRKNQLKGRLMRQLKPKTYPFKRDLETVFQLNTAPPPEGWSVSGNRIGINLGWSLGSLGLTSVAEFQALFAQYKLSGARIKLFFSNTQTGVDGNEFSNSQLIVRMANNQDGTLDTLNDQYWQETQAKKYRTAINGGKPLDLYMPLKLVNSVNAQAGLGRTMMSPKYLPISDTGVVHYGINLSVERADGLGFSTGQTNYQYCRMITTLYFNCRTVQ